MKTQLAATRGRHDHPPQPVHQEDPWRARRVGLLDRAALHLGVALIKWGRRSVKPDRPANLVEVHEARREMERVRAEQSAMFLTRFR
jgi:hypothetical protein